MTRFGEFVERYRYPVQVWAESIRDWHRRSERVASVLGQLREGTDYMARPLDGKQVGLPYEPHVADQLFVAIGGRGDTSEIGAGLDVVGPQIVVPPTTEAR